MVEYSSTDKVHKVLEEHKFSEDGRSYIVVDGQQVTMSKYKQRLNQAERAMRKIGSAEGGRSSQCLHCLFHINSRVARHSVFKRDSRFFLRL